MQPLYKEENHKKLQNSTFASSEEAYLPVQCVPKNKRLFNVFYLKIEDWVVESPLFFFKSSMKQKFAKRKIFKCNHRLTFTVFRIY